MRWAVLSVVLVGLILLPFLLFGAQVDRFAADVAQGGTRAAAGAVIFGLLAFDVFLPVPSSIVSTAAGAVLGFVPGAAVVWAGMMAGSLVGYRIGSSGAGAARRFVGVEGVERAAAVARRYGDLAIVLCRPVPVLAEATVVFAGLVRAPYPRFVRLTALANLGIAVGYAALGAFSLRMDAFLVAFLGALLVPGLLLLIARLLWGREKPAASRPGAGDKGPQALV